TGATRGARALRLGRPRRGPRVHPHRPGHGALRAAPEGATVMALLRALLNLPPQASTYAASIDLLHFFVIATTMLGATFVFALALWFLVQNRRRAKGELTPEVRASVPAEMTTIGLLLTVF